MSLRKCVIGEQGIDFSNPMQVMGVSNFPTVVQQLTQGAWFLPVPQIAFPLRTWPSKQNECERLLGESKGASRTDTCLTLLMDGSEPDVLQLYIRLY